MHEENSHKSSFKERMKPIIVVLHVFMPLAIYFANGIVALCAGVLLYVALITGESYYRSKLVHYLTGILLIVLGFVWYETQSLSSLWIPCASISILSLIAIFLGDGNERELPNSEFQNR